MLFTDYLHKQGVSITRVKDLKSAFRALHSAVAHLDDDNFDIIKDIGLNELLIQFGQLEDLRVFNLNKRV